MKRWCVLASCLMFWVSSGFSQDVTVEKVNISSSFKGRIPLSISHLLGQRRKPPFPTNSYELVELTLANHTPETKTVELTLELVGLGQASSKTVVIKPNESVKVEASPIIEPRLIQDIVDERIGKLKIEVEEGSERVYSDTKDVTLLGKDDVPFCSYDDKGRARPARFLWVTRVQPKSPLVDAVLSAASQRWGLQLRKGLIGSGGSMDVKQMKEDIRKIYKTIQAMNFTYLATPISFDADFQRVKTASEALATKSGNCIDGTCVFASCITAIGYEAIIAMPPGHAFVIAALPPADNARSRHDRLAIFYPSKLSPSAMLSMVYPSYIPIETTVLQLRPGLTRATFEEAEQIGQDKLVQNKQITFIDVGAWREAGFIPFPED